MLRRLVALSVLLAVVLTPAALAASVKIRVEGKTHDDLRRGAAARQRPTTRSRRSMSPAWPASSTTATTTSFGDYVSQIGKYPAASSSAGWVFKVNGVSPPVGADKVMLKDGDVVLWYCATFGPTGGPPTLELQRLPGNCYVVAVGQRRRQADAGGDGDARSPTGSASRRRAGRACIGKHRARPGDRARRRALERGAVIRRALSALVVLVLLAGCGGAAGGEEGTARSGSRATAAPRCSSTRRSRRGRR